LTELAYESLNRLLLESVPELRPLWKREQEELGDDYEPGPHAFYGAVLMPFIREQVEAGENQELLRKIFGFLDRLVHVGARASIVR
jgi:hypothetical protein